MQVGQLTTSRRPGGLGSIGNAIAVDRSLRVDGREAVEQQPDLTAALAGRLHRRRPRRSARSDAAARRRASLAWSAAPAEDAGRWAAPGVADHGGSRMIGSRARSARAAGQRAEVEVQMPAVTKRIRYRAGKSRTPRDPTSGSVPLPFARSLHQRDRIPATNEPRLPAPGTGPGAANADDGGDHEFGTCRARSRRLDGGFDRLAQPFDRTARNRASAPPRRPRRDRRARPVPPMWRPPAGETTRSTRPS